ncbi:MAG: hypothetical protein ACRC1K_22925 [Planctomycetia bacterium]
MTTKNKSEADDAGEGKKSAGYPRETDWAETVDPLEKRLVAAGLVAARALRNRLKKAGYLDAAYMAQLTLLADGVAALVRESLDLEPTADAPAAVVARWVEVLLAAPEVKGGVAAAFVVPLLLRGDPAAALKLLATVGGDPSMAAREGAQVALRRYAIDHGTAVVLPWTTAWWSHPNDGVRRLPVEALRPRGVWVPHLADVRRDPAVLFPMLDAVVDDPSLYVRKAVANSLNDISKDHPDMAAAWARTWLEQSRTPDREWVAKRGLRSLTAGQHPAAKALFAMPAADQFAVTVVDPPPASIPLGGVLPITLTATDRRPLDAADPSHRIARLELRLTSANERKGGRPAVRKFLVQAVRLTPAATVQVVRRIRVTQRNSRPTPLGATALILLCNGEPVWTGEIELTD